jgi:hypothetical protein
MSIILNPSSAHEVFATMSILQAARLRPRSISRRALKKSVAEDD